MNADADLLSHRGSMPSLSRLLLLLVPLLVLAGCALAAAQDAAGVVVPSVPLPGAAASRGMESVDYLLGLGPIGALVWGAWLLGKGVTITITHKHEFTDETLERVEKVFAARRSSRGAA